MDRIIILAEQYERVTPLPTRRGWRANGDEPDVIALVKGRGARRRMNRGSDDDDDECECYDADGCWVEDCPACLARMRGYAARAAAQADVGRRYAQTVQHLRLEERARRPLKAASSSTRSISSTRSTRLDRRADPARVDVFPDVCVSAGGSSEDDGFWPLPPARGRARKARQQRWAPRLARVLE